MSCETRAGSGRAPTTSRMGLFKGKQREKTEAEQVAEDYNIIGKDKRIHPEEEEEEDEEESIPEPEPEPEPELSELDVASLKMKCASLGLKQSGAREELIHRIEEATHESEEEPDVIAEDAEKAVHRTFEGKKARKKQWSGGRDSRTIRAEKEFAQKEKERLARDAERLAREAAKPKLLEALAPVKRKGGCFNACYDRYVLGLGKYKHVDYSDFTPYLGDFAHLGLKEPDVCRLLNIFLKIDSDRSGYMDSFEFLMWAVRFPRPRSPESRRVSPRAGHRAEPLRREDLQDF